MFLVTLKILEFSLTFLVTIRKFRYSRHQALAFLVLRFQTKISYKGVLKHDYFLVFKHEELLRGENVSSR